MNNLSEETLDMINEDARDAERDEIEQQEAIDELTAEARSEGYDEGYEAGLSDAISALERLQ